MARQTLNVVPGSVAWPVLTTRRVIPSILIILTTNIRSAAPTTWATRPTDSGTSCCIARGTTTH